MRGERGYASLPMVGAASVVVGSGALAETMVSGNTAWYAAVIPAVLAFTGTAIGLIVQQRHHRQALDVEIKADDAKTKVDTATLVMAGWQEMVRAQGSQIASLTSRLDETQKRSDQCEQDRHALLVEAEKWEGTRAIVQEEREAMKTQVELLRDQLESAGVIPHLSPDEASVRHREEHR